MTVQSSVIYIALLLILKDDPKKEDSSNSSDLCTSMTALICVK